jgi:hypothetical protein
MQTRSQTRTHSNSLPTQVYLNNHFMVTRSKASSSKVSSMSLDSDSDGEYEFEHDFDESSRAWLANKRKCENGTYCYK